MIVLFGPKRTNMQVNQFAYQFQLEFFFLLNTFEQKKQKNEEKDMYLCDIPCYSDRNICIS